MSRHPRGMAVAGALFLIAACAALSAVVWLRLSVERQSARADERREQVLWLARSAAAQGVASESTVTLGDDTLKVKATLAKVEKTGEGKRIIAEAGTPRWGKAVVEATFGPDGRPAEWQERFERLPIDPHPVDLK